MSIDTSTEIQLSDFEKFTGELEYFKRDIQAYFITLKDTFLRYSKKIYTNDDVMDMLDISASTLQTWRDKGIINFRQHNRKIYYTQSDLDNYMESIKKKSFK